VAEVIWVFGRASPANSPQVIASASLASAPQLANARRRAAKIFGATLSLPGRVKDGKASECLRIGFPPVLIRIGSGVGADRGVAGGVSGFRLRSQQAFAPKGAAAPEAMV
jgi:hypothetical protein